MNQQTAFADLDPNFPRPQRALTQAEIARLTGANPVTINHAVAEGRIDLQADWRVQLEQFYRHFSEVAAGRRGDGALDLVQERARQSKSIADRNEFELRKARGEFAPKSLVCRVLAETASTARTNMLSLPSRIKARVPETPIRTFIALNEEVRIILTTLAAQGLTPDLVQAFAEWEANGKDPDEPKKPEKKEAKRSRRSAPDSRREKKDRSIHPSAKKKTRKHTRPLRRVKRHVQSVQTAAKADRKKSAAQEVSSDEI